jgi:multidrug efflux pump subunit AcrA (membrane-fusion protein)
VLGENALLKSGMFARVSLPVGKSESAILVSKDALVFGGESPMVFIADPDSKNPKQGKVRPVPVEMGVAQDGLIQVKGPLKAGEWVVVQGNERLRPGQEVLLAHTQTVEPKPKAPGNGTATGSDRP